MTNLSGRIPTKWNPKNIREKVETQDITLTASNYAQKVTVSGSITYVAIAIPGSSQSSSVWQAKKIDETTGVVVTWADGNDSFDNVATDLTALSYS